MTRTCEIAILAVALATCASLQAAQRGRPRMDEARRTLVSNRGTKLRGCSYSPNREGLEKIRKLGLNAVHEYAEGCALKYPAEGARAPGYNVEKIDAAVKLTKELGLYYIMTIGNDPGKHNKAWALDFWKFYAPRYADEPHVIYEIHNEPVKWGPPYSSDKANPTGAVEMNAECWKLIRSLAPKTPILVFSYSQTHGNNSKDILADVAKFNKLVAVDEKEVWSNTAIAFHGYAGSLGTIDACKGVLEAGYPMFMTEYYSTEWGGDNKLGRNDCELTGFLEEVGVSWLSFLYVPPAPWGLDVTDALRFKTPTELAGIAWKPDFGDWPKAQKLITDGGRAFEVGSWREKRIAEGASLSPKHCGDNKFVLLVREPGYYKLNLSCTASDEGGAFSVAFKGGKPLRLEIEPGETNVVKTVLLPFGRGVLSVKRVSGKSKMQRLNVVPRAAGPIADGVYHIVNKASGLSLAADGSVFQNADAEDDAHSWKVENLGAGQYRFVHKGTNGLLNRIFFGSDKINVVWYGWDSFSRDQRWLLRPGSEKGFFRIAPVATGYDVKPEKPESGAKLQQGKAPFAGEGERQWKVEKP